MRNDSQRKSPPEVDLYARGVLQSRIRLGRTSTEGMT